MNRPNPPRELTIIEHLPSKSAKHSLAPKFAEYQIGGTELVQIFLFNIHRKRTDHGGGRIQLEIAYSIFNNIYHYLILFFRNCTFWQNVQFLVVFKLNRKVLNLRYLNILHCLSIVYNISDYKVFITYTPI